MLRKSILLAIFLIIFGLPIAFTQDTARLQQLSKEIEQLTADFQAGKITPQEFQKRALELQNQSNAAATGVRQGMEQASAAYKYTDTQMRRLLEIYDQHNMIMANLNEKRITEADATRQTEPLKREIEQINAPFANLSREQSINISNQSAELEKQLKQIWPGAIMGMPPLKGAFPNDERDRNYMEVGKFTRPIRQAPNTKASYDPIGSNSFGRVIHWYDIYQTGPGATWAALEDLKRHIESDTGKTMERRPDGLGYNLEFIDNRKDPEDLRIRNWTYHYITLRGDTIRHQIRDGAYDFGPNTTLSGEH